MHLSVLYGVSARMIRHLKFLHKNPDVMIHIRAYEEYDGNQEKHGAKSFRDGVHTYIQYMYFHILKYIHTYIHTHIHRYIHTYIHTHTNVVQIYIHTCTQTQACIHVIHTKTNMHTYIHMHGYMYVGVFDEEETVSAAGHRRGQVGLRPSGGEDRLPAETHSLRAVHVQSAGS